MVSPGLNEVSTEDMLDVGDIEDLSLERSRRRYLRGIGLRRDSHENGILDLTYECSDEDALRKASDMCAVKGNEVRQKSILTAKATGYQGAVSSLWSAYELSDYRGIVFVMMMMILMLLLMPLLLFLLLR